MSYMRELDAWLEQAFAGFAERSRTVKNWDEQQAVFEALKKAFREKVLESYRNGIASLGHGSADLCNTPAPQPKQERENDKKRDPKPQHFTGNWQCSECGGTITSLPFEPKGENASGLLCKPCWKAKHPKREAHAA